MASQTAIRVRVEVKADHTIRLPDEVPVGPAEVIVLPRSGGTRKGAIGIDAGKGFSVPDDINAPLPSDIQAAFDGDG